MKFISILILVNLISWSALSQNEDPNLPVAETPDVEQLESEILTYLEPYIYDVDGRRDPFQPFKVYVEAPSMDESFEEEAPIKQEIAQPKQPLLRYNLSQLNLKAILWNVKNPKAVIEDPVKNLHTLILNDKIGNNGGYVASIREGEVVVVQKVSVQGKEIVSTKFMRLKR